MQFHVWLHPPQSFVRLGGHQLVQTGIAGEAVFKRYNVAGAANQSAACRHIGDITELGVRDMEQIRQFIPVGGRLVQKKQKLRVCQHEAGSIGPEQFFHILCQPCHQPVVFSDSFPQLVEKVGAVLIAEQQVKLIGKYPGGFAFLPVLNHPVEDGVEGDQHSDGHELFPQFPDIIGDDPGFGIHIGLLGKGVEAAGDEQFGGQRQPSGFRLRLF